MRHRMKARALGWLVVAGLVAGALVGPTIGVATAAPLNGAIWTSLADGTSVNANIYDSKGDVYLNGGPQNCGNGNGLPDGDYYFQVTDPSGDTLLSSDAIKFRQVEVVNGVIAGTSGEGNHVEGTSGCNGGTPVRLLPYDDTPNSGGEYSVDLAPVAEVEACEGFDADEPFNFLPCNTSSKNDNFKVGEEPSAPPSDPPSAPPSEPPPPGEAEVVIVKVLDIDGDLDTEDDQTAVADWSFDIAVTGGTPSDDTVVTAEQAGSTFPFAALGLEIDGDSAAVEITEQLQADFEIIDAFCFTDTEDVEAIGTLEDVTLSVDLEPENSYLCVFFNTGGDVAGATGTPNFTPPPTDVQELRTQSSDGPRLLLIVAAALIATLLIVTPTPASRRRR
jgi:hypothetical protein